MSTKKKEEVKEEKRDFPLPDIGDKTENKTEDKVEEKPTPKTSAKSAAKPKSESKKSDKSEDKTSAKEPGEPTTPAQAMASNLQDDELRAAGHRKGR